MSISIKIDAPGMRKLKERFKERPAKVVSALREALHKAAFVLEAESKRAITYGETRAIDTGRLRSELIVRELSTRELKASIYPIVFYGTLVHEGTYKMRGRPFFQVAARQGRPQAQDIFTEEINQALK